ncbi:MAG TPA: hypothetical protein VMK16_03130, partial [Acidimicrobiales bacterium]|nr:hypothetical protein [Acidimicrobiales bacterium]
MDHDHDTDFVTIAAVYPALAGAEADYARIKSLYYDADMMDTFDAAVLTRTTDGNVEIVKKHEQPTRLGGWAGAGIGLAVGAIVALFPGAAFGAALLVGTGGGAVIGALAGHVAEGLDRKDLDELGELLDKGESGLIVVAARDEAARMDGDFSHASEVMRK